jgi:hypothetical protein
LSTAITASLVSAVGEHDRALLTWSTAGATGATAIVYRKAPERDWEPLGMVSADGSGRIVFEDRNVEPGVRYGYRLGPAGKDVLVAFSLPSRERATLELFDLAGRRVHVREVGALGPGSHVVRLDESGRLHTGVYVVRLEQSGRVLTAKAAIVR